MAVRTGLKAKRKARLERELERLVAELKAMGATRIILFGSLAADRVGAHSDLDLIAIMPSDKPFSRRLEEVYSTLVPSVAADIVIYTPEEFEELSRWSAFVQSAIKKGKVLYEA